jgi:hypothetical protein
MPIRTAVKVLLALVLGLPLLQAVLVWVGRLFQALGDVGTTMVLGHVNTAIGIAWLVSVVGLVVGLALQSLEAPEEPEG